MSRTKELKHTKQAIQRHNNPVIWVVAAIFIIGFLLPVFGIEAPDLEHGPSWHLGGN